MYFRGGGRDGRVKDLGVKIEDGDDFRRLKALLICALDSFNDVRE